MRGIAYGIGVGPGDPELMTLKAVRLIRECDVIAVPGKSPKEAVAYKIARAAVPEMDSKALVSVNMPMIKDRALIDLEHRKAAKLLEGILDEGKNIAYITLGDPTVYCTFSYIQHIMETDGYELQLISGVPSFCAAAARLGVSLAEWNEPLHILPAVHRLEDDLRLSGNYVLMKSASGMSTVKARLKESGREVGMVENCGMENERVYHGVDEIPDDAGYFSLIIAKEP
ncbi:MAG: precorrin-2 C(20)-methyltransferase, partial [Clostridia bacterium]|nr:precorrin-2 C(20)-methyltransferase [Clostridia bacterium]